MEEAERLLPQVAPDKRRMAALALLAREWTQRPGDTALLGALREAATHPQPERELTRLLSRLTGAYVAIHASWGDLIAASGEARPGRTWTLRHGTRQVGTLTAAGDPAWTPLWPLAAEYALLARLQSAAAGAARRRVGERALDSLLAGQSSGPGTRVPGMGEKPFALAVARPSHAAGVGARAALARAVAALGRPGIGIVHVGEDPDEAIAQNQDTLTEAFFNEPDGNDWSKIFATRMEVRCS